MFVLVRFVLVFSAFYSSGYGEARLSSGRLGAVGGELLGTEAAAAVAVPFNFYHLNATACSCRVQGILDVLKPDLMYVCR